MGRYATLEPDGRVDVTVSSSGSVYGSRLVVDDVRAADAGMYICSLSTAAGHVASSHAYLTVYNSGTSCRPSTNPLFRMQLKLQIKTLARGRTDHLAADVNYFQPRACK